MKKNMINLRIPFIICSLCLYQSFAQDSWIDNKEFCINGQEYTTIWGSGKSIPGVYFDEYLPAFFTRKLQFSKSDLKTSKLKWVFTGDDGGATISITSDSIKLEQRYYDSFGFNQMKNGELIAERYPQNQFTEFKTALKVESVTSVTLKVTHGLGLMLYVNDSLVNEQITQLDFSRHQMLIEGLKLDVCGKLQIPKASEVAIKLNATKKYQEILGFGGITSPVAYGMLSAAGKEKWWDFLKEYNLLIQREYPMGQKLKEDYSNWDKLDEATPHYYGDNFPNGEVSDFEYNKKIQEIGGMVVFEFWQFPDWMIRGRIENYKESGGMPIYSKYTEAIIDYCKTAKQKTGQAPAIVGIQNEVEQTSEIWQQLTLHLRKALDKNGFQDVKIHMHNGSRLWQGIKALKAFTEKKNVWEKIDYSASNLYDYQEYFTNPDGFDKVISEWQSSFNGRTKKPFISTEMCINYPKYQSGSYRVAFLMGELYHKNMVDFNAISMMYCWLLINNVQPSFTASRSLFGVDKNHNNLPEASSFQLRVFGAFSRHLKKGARRIEASSSDEDVLVSAYLNKKRKTVIILNRSTVPKKIELESLGNFEMMEIVSPYQQNQQIKITDKGQIALEPGHIVTLY